MKSLNISEIKIGDILFLEGKDKFIPNQIRKAQRKVYPNSKWTKLTHVGVFDIDKHLGLTVLEQDYPGKTQESSFEIEYLNQNESVYVGRLKNVPKETIHELLKEMKLLAGEDKLLNYSYKSLIGLLHQAIYFKVMGEFPRRFLTGKPKKGFTCNQIIVKFLADEGYYLTPTIEWYRTYPVSLALSNRVELFKLEL